VTDRGAQLVDSPAGAPALAASPDGDAPGRCLNCDSPLIQRYCAACGQAASDPDPTLREFIRELAAEFFLWDGKLFTTLRLLVAKPGELTREYLAGHRVRYIAPLKLYLTCSVVFFLFRAVAPEPTVVVRRGGVINTQIGGVVVQEDEAGEAARALDSLATASASAVGRMASGRLSNVLRHQKEFVAAMRANTPRMMFVLVPLFAALTALVFRGRRMHYPKHLTFALHAHAFLFLALIPSLVPRIASKSPVGAALSATAVAVSFSAIAVHLVLAIRRVYGGTLASVVARSALLAAAYFACFTTALLTTVAIVMALQF
jgi:hypothetical protein